MTRTPERDLEQSARLLEGEVLAAVHYQRAGSMGEAEHAVEHVVFLDFVSGTRVVIGCDDDLGVHHGFGVTVKEQRVIDSAFGEVILASKTPAWKPLIGHAITRARIRWDDVRSNLRSSLAIGVAIHADYLRRQDYPASLELETNGSRISFTAARRGSDGSVVLFVNALLISFSLCP